MYGLYRELLKQGFLFFLPTTTVLSHPLHLRHQINAICFSFCGQAILKFQMHFFCFHASYSLLGLHALRQVRLCIFHSALLHAHPSGAHVRTHRMTRTHTVTSTIQTQLFSAPCFSVPTSDVSHRETVGLLARHLGVAAQAQGRGEETGS